MLTAAAQLMNYANQEKANGDLAYVQKQFLNALQAFYTAQLNASKGYQTMNSFGGIVPQSALQAEMNKVTIAERQYAANYIQSYGMYAFFELMASTLEQLANGNLGVHGVRQFTIQQARLFTDAVVVVGTILAAGTGVPEAIGLGLLIGAAVSAFYLDMIQ
jgi:hypothetical protein